MDKADSVFLNPRFGFNFKDLFDPFRLKSLTKVFFEYFEKTDKIKYEQFINYSNSKGAGLNDLRISEILIDSSIILSDFLTELFNLENERNEFLSEANYVKDIFVFKKEFVQKVVRKKFKSEDLAELNYKKLDEFVSDVKKEIFPGFDFKTDEEKYTAKMVLELADTERIYKWFYEGDKFAPDNFVIPEDVSSNAKKVMSILNEKGILKTDNIDDGKNISDNYKYLMSEISKWIFAKMNFDAAAIHWVSFSDIHKIDYGHLVNTISPDPDFPELLKGPEETHRRRFGFRLTDPRMKKREVLEEVDYCLYCHEREKDSCSKGYADRSGNIKSNPLGIKLDGCPLNEKISEMQYVRKLGHPVASLALVMIDNPNVPGTGHRICNDCMKGCIFQTQDPVNIPQIETNVLTDILRLPYGYEIYSLLSRWNPLNIRQPETLPYNGKNVLIAGLGPAGYTLAQFLLNEGFGVIGIDGLKIEKIHKKYTGVKNKNGFEIFPEPVKYFDKEIREDLDKRVLQGFGGVSEYGITVRWDKNFLTAIYINLARREFFRIYDGVRFGGTVTADDAWKYGADHIAIATGAGKPTIIRMKNNLIRGIRKASDFLMALQLTGASKKNNLANLQVQLPAVVIGGGLTAIDASTELLAYYPVQVLKALEKYNSVSENFGEDVFWSKLNDEETEIMRTFLEHGKEVRLELDEAERENRMPDMSALVRKWGGVTMVYRKGLIDSPAYRLNHEEIIEALNEGIEIVEHLSPVEAVKNNFGAVEEMVFEFSDKVKIESKRKTLKTFKAKTVLVAAGTSPNIIYEKEYPGTFELDDDGYFFKSYKLETAESGIKKLVSAGKDETGFFTSYEKDGRYITFYGDNHPVYAGNVVKAMASAKDGYEKISDLFYKDVDSVRQDYEISESLKENFYNTISKLDHDLTASIVKVERLTPDIIEVVIKAPAASRNFEPGQFYRLQNYETEAEKINGTVLSTEGLAMTGAWTDKDNGLISVIVLEMGVSSKLCARFREGEKVVLMGPTGKPTEIKSGENVLLAGGGLGNAVLFSIAKKLKEKGNNILYFAGYKNSQDVYKMDDVEAGTDQVIWSNDAGEKIIPRRSQDLSFKGNIVEAMKAYSDGKLGNRFFEFGKIDRIIVIGSDRMMRAVKDARSAVFGNVLKEHTAIGSINSPMQCMMKEICAQCLQRHIDPDTGRETFVFSCFNQDQHLDRVDFENLNQRLKANSVLEKLSDFYLYTLLSGNSKIFTDNGGVKDMERKADSIMKGH
ncbi:MAG TPA: FAD-dependent oxidoreductase [Ignavibacteria bacterium]|nr:FAD-dependent oxidoreductase [Ignavibacteria bacterium]